MTTIQAIFFGLVHGFSEVLPISSRTHHIFLPYLLGWPEPGGALLGALSLGSLLALLIFFRHDWASLISSTIQLLVYRRKPKTLDEWLPIFIVITTVPALIVRTYFHDRIAEMEFSLTTVAIIYAGFGVALWFFDSMSRSNKGIYDWNWLDAGIVGILQASMFIPGCDHLGAVLIGASMLNYKREAAAKYAYLVSAPVLLGGAIHYLEGVDFHASAPMPELSWLSFWMALIVTAFTALLFIGGFMRQVQKRGFSQYMLYRGALAVIVLGFFWYRTK